LQFDRESRCLLAGRVNLEDRRSGQSLTLQLSSLGESIRGLGAGVDDQQGDPVEGAQRMMSTWDLADPAVRQRTSRGTIDTLVSARLAGAGEVYEGVGVAETAIGGARHVYGPALRRVVV